MIGFMLCNFLIYSIIPYFIQRSGATLLNISNVTTVIWGMLSDILFFGKSFYILYCVAFCFEMTGVVIFSTTKPRKREVKDSLEADAMRREQKLNSFKSSMSTEE
jgi:drug/metabolite transporter (DMT)-like permease